MKPDDDRLLDHEYDGIKEYDNPMPRWWLATFWVTILFSVLYLLDVPVLGSGPGRVAEYQAEMAVAAKLAAAQDPLAGLTRQRLLSSAADPAVVGRGTTTFTAMCASCHAADGGGGIGPNLTDRYWLHGGDPMAVLKTVVEGVPAKGMPAWGRMLKPDQVQSVTAYVVSLRGSTPKAPKAPQGVADSIP